MYRFRDASSCLSSRYKSDFTDAFHIQSLASIMFLYFAALSPIITFGGLLGEATDHHLAAVESLCAGCICGVVYSLCSGQPLSLLNATGPVLVFESIVFSFCKWVPIEPGQPRNRKKPRCYLDEKPKCGLRFKPSRNGTLRTHFFRNEL